MSTADESKRAHRRWLEELVAGGDLGDLSHFVAEDAAFFFHGSFHLEKGVAGIHELLNLYRAGFSDFNVSVGQQVAEGDTVASTYTLSGTHRAAVRGLERSMKRIWCDGFEIARFAGGKIVSLTVHLDTLGFLIQVEEQTLAFVDRALRRAQTKLPEPPA